MRDSSSLNVTIQTWKYADELTWKIRDEWDDLVCQGGPYDDQNYQNLLQFCEIPHGNLTLECRDSWFDGWDGGYIEINGHQYCGEDEF